MLKFHSCLTDIACAVDLRIVVRVLLGIRAVVVPVRISWNSNKRKCWLWNFKLIILQQYTELSKLCEHSKYQKNDWNWLLRNLHHFKAGDICFYPFEKLWKLSILSKHFGSGNFRRRRRFHNHTLSHCLGLDLNGLLTRRNFWHIPGMLGSYTIPK